MMLRRSYIGNTERPMAFEEEGAGGGDGAGAGGGTTTPERPEALGPGFDKYWRDDAGVDFGSLATDFEAAQKFQLDNSETIERLTERRQNIPEDINEYEPTLPEGFEGPEGWKFEISPDDPLLAEAREYAKSAGLTKDEFRDLIGLRAKLELAEDNMIQDAMKEEMKKLGSNAQSRVDAVFKFLGAEVDASAKAKGQQGQGTAFQGTVFTAAQIVELENLIAKAKNTGQGFSGGGRTGNEPPALTDEEWERMSPTDRLRYAHEQTAKKNQAA